LKREYRDEPTKRLVRHAFGIDPAVVYGDISQTFPEAERLAEIVDAVEKADIKKNRQTWAIVEETRAIRADILSIVHCLSPKFALGLSMRHPEEVAIIALGAANMIRDGEGKIKSPPDGSQRRIPRQGPDTARDRTRVIPAPLKVMPAHVLTGVTPVTLRNYTATAVPDIHRNEHEDPALLAPGPQGRM
jgi:hypothetical protein